MGASAEPLSPGRPIRLASRLLRMQHRICLRASAAILAVTLPFLLAPQTHQTCCVSGSPERQFCWTTSLLTTPPLGQVNGIMYQAKSLQLESHPLTAWCTFPGNRFSQWGGAECAANWRPLCKFIPPLSPCPSHRSPSGPGHPSTVSTPCPSPPHLCLSHRPRDASLSELRVQGEEANTEQI